MLENELRMVNEWGEKTIKLEIEDLESYQKEPLYKLIYQITGKHHHYIIQQLTYIDMLLVNLRAMHEDNHPESLHIRNCFRRLEQVLHMHFVKEKQMIFPHVICLEEAALTGKPAPSTLFGNLLNPINVMRQEHNMVLEILREIRKSSSNYTVPPDAYISYQTLYLLLQELEEELNKYIELENKILFPRVLEMDGSVSCI
jgi:regulator of cell morphogenesis and NO signaling